MPRERLPDRRQAETVDVHYGGQRFHLTIGEFPDGRPGEIFLHGATVGSDVDGLCGDVGVLISRLLQFGDNPAALAAGIGRLGNGDPASIVGAVVARRGGAMRGRLINLVGIRIYADNGAEWVPTPKGVTIRIDLLADLTAALREAEREARRAGFIPAESDATG